jgi:MoaA/NifB/PqqE/SkfB family radical SAM enzyme
LQSFSRRRCSIQSVLGRLKTVLKRRAFKTVRWCVDRVDGFRKTPPPFDGRVPPPDRVTIETTRYCNLTCRMCLPFLEGITVTGPHVELEKFRRWAEQLFPFVKRFQPSVSGEPLMTKNLPEMIRLARRFGVKLELVTNATLLNARMQDLLLGCTSRVIFSFDGADKETFEHIRRDAVFEHVVENIKSFANKAKALPAADRPLLGFNVTIMRRNVRQLPAIVRLAKDLGMEFVTASHVFPASAEIRAESLVHDQELARASIDEAVEAAKQAGLYLKVLALDQCVAANALAHGQARTAADADGVVAGLEEREIGTVRPDPVALTRHEPEVAARREDAWTTNAYPRPQPSSRFPKLHEPIWVCEFLWSMSYVQLEGGVRPCCMPGPPELGSLEKQTFAEIWNGDAYREMRQRLVVRDPIAVCRGCQHIKEIRNPRQIASWLQRRSAPAAKDVIESEYSRLPAIGAAPPGAPSQG